MEGGVSGSAGPENEKLFEKQVHLRYESQVRDSTAQTLDQLEEWIKENPIPYISNDKFSHTVYHLGKESARIFKN